MTLKHRMSSTATFRIWSGMLSRCYNAHATKYPNYGGRGIAVCESWRDFAGFYADMGNRPKGMTLGRIDNDGNYEPANCRWESLTEQARNKRNTRWIQIGEVIKSLPEWCEVYGIAASVVYARIHKLGWDGARAVTTPKNPPDFMRGKPAPLTDAGRQVLRDKAKRQWADGSLRVLTPSELERVRGGCER